MKQIHAEKYRQIGLKIAYYRKLRGFTQEELAEQVGLTPAFVGHLEAPNITKALSLDTLFDIANISVRILRCRYHSRFFRLHSSRCAW